MLYHAFFPRQNGAELAWGISRTLQVLSINEEAGAALCGGVEERRAVHGCTLSG